MTGFCSPNYTQTPNDLLGDRHEPGLMADMGLSELKVILAVTRLTLGYHTDEVRASITTLQRMTGLCRQSVIKGAEQAEQRGLIQRTNDGGVTTWALVVQNLDQQSTQLTMLVQNLDQTSLENRPPSIKETSKEINKEEGRGKRATPAAIRVFRDAAKHNPKRAQYDAIVQAVSEDDLDFWEKVVRAWHLVGWNPYNVKGMLEHYRERRIPGDRKNGGGSNGTYRSSSGSLGKPAADDIDLAQVERDRAALRKARAQAAG